MERVITCGTFNHLRCAHINLLQRARALGDDWRGKLDFLEDEGVKAACPSRTLEVSTTRIKEYLMG